MSSDTQDGDPVAVEHARLAALDRFASEIASIRQQLASLETRVATLELAFRDHSPRDFFAEQIAKFTALEKRALADEYADLVRIEDEFIATESEKKISRRLEESRCNVLGRIDGIEFIEFEAFRWKAGEKC